MKRQSGPAVAVIAIIVMLPILYFLSIGPLVWLDSRGILSIDDPPWSVIYDPVGSLIER